MPGLEIYNRNGTASTANRVFILYPSKITWSQSKTSVERMEIPGNIWNMAFDTSNQERKISVEGTFRSTSNIAWNPITYAGMIVDFKTRLGAVAAGINPITGASDPNLEFLFLKINYDDGGIENMDTVYSSLAIAVLITNISFPIEGGVPNLCRYVIEFTEVSNNVTATSTGMHVIRI